MNKIAAAYPDRVKKLVYLDALDIGSDDGTSCNRRPPRRIRQRPGIGATLCRSQCTFRWIPKAAAAICNMIRTDTQAEHGATTPPEISKDIEGLQPAEYDRIQAPALGIFNKITPQYRLPYYWYLDPAKQEEFNRNIESLAKWIEGAIQRFRSGVKNSRVIELHDTNHYVFIVDEALVVREMRKFLLEE